MRTVLVIDEDTSILNAFEQFFQREGFEMIGSSSYAEAEKKLMASHIDLIIMDVSPLRNSRFEFLMKTKQLCPATPIIGLSPYKEFQNDPTLLPKEIACFIPKPVDIQKLRDAIDLLMGIRGNETENRVEKKSPAMKKFQIRSIFNRNMNELHNLTNKYITI